MSDTRTYIVPDGQENSTNQMLPWMAMMNGGMGGFGNGMWNNPFMYLVWMWMMRWMNRGEFGDGNSCQNLQSAEIQGQLAGLREQMNTNQNTQLLMDAISFMKKGGKSLEPVSKEYIDKVLTQNNIKLENNVGYDYVFVGNMCKADYYGSSITDERHFALYIKDTIDDEDAGDGTTMRRWYATMVANGTMVDWEDVI